MAESLHTRSFRWLTGLIPAYRGTGGRITYIAGDWREVHVEVPLSWRTRNYVGTIYGGSMYGAIDPVYMIMLLRLLGPEYLVWDKAASIRFRKPGRTTLRARFHLPEEETDEIRRALRRRPSIERTYRVELADRDGVVHATVEKTLWIGRKDVRPARSGRRGAARCGGRERALSRSAAARSPRSRR